jgi:hypothetical protein
VLGFSITRGEDETADANQSDNRECKERIHDVTCVKARHWIADARPGPVREAI